MQPEEARMYCLRRIHGCFQNIQGWDGEIQEQTEVHLAKGMKNSRKFYRLVSQKRVVKKRLFHLINEMGELRAKDIEKAELFASVFSDSQDSHISHGPETLGGNWRRKFKTTS